ncbi:hypothetical protein [Paenibacillus sp. YPG26]|uniref:hypothetical protein n=1 Tax=Paenibacillus sp. YPG26 TaxID=2878915 RepID=UPI0020414B2A|nr:hypothetical protein [Paenibacillus sp. YPG26]USB32165.1 hypothetical protein LDO05_12560 [Paenibacillus sp. YPG26]
MQQQRLFRLVRALAAVFITAGAAFGAFSGKVSALSEPYAVRPPGNEVGHADGRTGKQHGHFYGHLVRETASLLGISHEAVIAELKQGKSLRQIALEKKGWSEADYVLKLKNSISARIDHSVASGKLSPDKADKFKALLPGKIQKAVNRTCKGMLIKPPHDTSLNPGQNQINRRINP